MMKSCRSLAGSSLYLNVAGLEVWVFIVPHTYFIELFYKNKFYPTTPNPVDIDQFFFDVITLHGTAATNKSIFLGLQHLCCREIFLLSFDTNIDYYCTQKIYEFLLGTSVDDSYFNK